VDRDKQGGISVQVDSIKFDGEYVVIDHSGLIDYHRIGSRDEPRVELIKAAKNVVYEALKLLAIEIAGSFRKASLSYGDEPGSRLELSIPTDKNQDARLSLPKIDNPHKFREEVFPGEFKPRSDDAYNDALKVLVDEAEKYVNGERKQKEFDYEDEPAHVVEFAGAR
jgi:hypothetical protein